MTKKSTICIIILLCTVYRQHCIPLLHYCNDSMCIAKSLIFSFLCSSYRIRSLDGYMPVIVTVNGVNVKVRLKVN